MTMNGYMAGWYSEGQENIDSSSVLHDMRECFNAEASYSEIRTEKLHLICSGGDSFTSDSIDVIIQGRPYWKDREIQNLSSHLGAAEACAKQYHEMGVDFISNLFGRFTLFVFDRRSDTLLIALDRIGQQHCYFAKTNSGLVVSTRADAVTKHPNVSKKIDRQAIYNYLYFHSIPSPSSIYRGIGKLKNGELLQFNNGRIETKTYWNPQFSEKEAGQKEELYEELRNLVHRAVKRNLDGIKAGSFLSGGLDSSTVSGMLSSILGDQAQTFSIGFHAKGYDETEFARTAANHFSTVHNEYYVTPDDVIELVPTISKYFDEPFGNSSALPAYFCARMAKERGVSMLLAGDGGDEIFAGNERYTKQLLFEKYSLIPNVFKSLIVEPIFLNSLAGSVPYIKKVGSYIRQAKIPLPDRLETYNFLTRHNAEEIFSPDYLSDIDVEKPIHDLKSVYNSLPSATSLNRMLWLDWKRTLHDNDLVKVNRMCELSGVNVEYPMLDDDLVEFSCKIPTSLKLDGGLRGFFKGAFKEFLPDQIINKSKHGFGLPFGIWTAEHDGLKDMSYSALQSLKKRGIFKEEFIDETISMHQHIHAKYYGELVWILMMFEYWISDKEL
ncbi:MAG: asparagine synthase-related protein [Sedimenticola sp.]